MSKYNRLIVGTDPHDHLRDCVIIDVYSVLLAFDVRCPATQHAIKKLLMAGQRGHKDAKTDLEEAKHAIDRAIELLGNKA